jgi:hypothetical protein
MIQGPPGFREWRSGDVLTYAPRGGRVHCVMTYEERVAPLRSVRELVAEVLADDADFQAAETDEMVRFVTQEGEYGARSVIKGHHRGRPIVHIVAAVLADDFATRLAARVERAHLEAYLPLVDGLIRRDRLALGVRRRRIAFTPPPGWHPIPGVGLEVVLLAPDYPRVPAMLTVYPAEPLATGRDPRRLEEERDARLDQQMTEESGRILGAGRQRKGVPLVGEEWIASRPLSADRGKLLRHLVVLRDSAYAYSVKLEAAEEDAAGLRPVFMRLIDSIETIPTARTDADTAHSFEMWSG